MNKYDLIKVIEDFAPLDFQESWDCSGWIIDNFSIIDVYKVLLCLTPTEYIIKQALDRNCDMIISHHPMFYIDCKNSENFTIPIELYCAHTNFDKTNGGTTDNLIKHLKLEKYKKNIKHDFLRFVDIDISTEDFSKIIKTYFPNARFVNNKNIKDFSRLAFCAGSGSDLIEEAYSHNADCLITGDLKFHTALDSPIALYDIGHFESEIISLPILENLIKPYVKVLYAKEKTPFQNLT